MLRLHRILFPTDFSACAEGAFTHAAYLAQRTGAELHVLHIVEEAMTSPGDWVQDLRITPDDIAADLDMPLPMAPEQGPEDAVPLIDAEEHAERAAPAILRYAEAHDIDLVVMGTHGRRGLRRLVMGSVAEEVVRLAACPVFTVGGRERDEGSWAIRRILAPTDFSDHALLAARHAAALAEAYGADLDLLHIVDATLLPTGGSVPFVPVHVSVEDIQNHSHEALKQRAAELEGEFPTLGDIGVHTQIGRPASDIVDFADTLEADLVVIGSHGRTGMERLLMGSVADEIIRTAPCPVFTVKSFGRTLLSASLEREKAEPAVEA